MRARTRSYRVRPVPPVRVVKEVVHAAPAGGLSFTSCCDRTLQELPPYHRVSRYPDEVTCGRLTERDRLLLSGGLPDGRLPETERMLYEMAVSLRALRGPELSLPRALQYVQQAVRELAPIESGAPWPAALLVRITARADELAAD